MSTLTPLHVAVLAYFADPSPATRAMFTGTPRRFDEIRGALIAQGLLTDIDRWPYTGASGEGRRVLREARAAKKAPPPRPRSGDRVAPIDTKTKTAGRIPDDAWNAFRDKTAAQGTTITAKLTEWIERYLRGELD